jgi:hypothetical protein
VLGLGGRRRVAAQGSHLGLAREAEIEDLHAPVARQEQVLRLQVPVDDALVMRGREAMRHLRPVLGGLASR